MVTISLIKKGKENSSDILPRFPSNDVSASFIVSHVIHVLFYIVCCKTVWTIGSQPEDALAFYGVYHQKTWNQIIHFFCVPVILWTLLVVAVHSTLSNTVILIPGMPPHHLSWLDLWGFLFAFFYFRIDTVGALLFAPVLYVMLRTAVTWAQKDQQCYYQETEGVRWFGTGQLVLAAIGLHFLSWYLQIHPGHLILEGAKPAGASDLGAALTTAPLFAFYEGIWALGLRTGLQQRVLEQVSLITVEKCARGEPMRVCETL